MGEIIGWSLIATALFVGIYNIGEIIKIRKWAIEEANKLNERHSAWQSLWAKDINTLIQLEVSAAIETQLLQEKIKKPGVKTPGSNT